MFHLNDQWELPHGRKCQRVSWGSSLGSGLVDSDDVEQNRFGSVYLAPLQLCQRAAKCDFMLGECQDPVWQIEVNPAYFQHPLSLSPCHGCYLPLKELLDVSQNQAPDVWKTFADKVINLFGGQMLSENFPATALWVSKFIRNIN